MQAVWYYAQSGQSHGPESAAQIRARIALAPDQPHLVWTQGMAEWTEARLVPEFAAGPEQKSPQAPPREPQKKPAAGKAAQLALAARRELTEFFAISGYLYVCFGALILYKAAILHSVGVIYAPAGLAIVKALISAKFIMLLHAVKLGERAGRRNALLTAILRKSLVFSLFLIVLTLIEETIVGAIHGRSLDEVLSEIAGGDLYQALATGLLLFLIMIPYFGFREIAPSLSESRD
jgi:hypothetical protein